MEGLLNWTRRLPKMADGKRVMTNDDINRLCEALAYLSAEFIHSS